MFHLRYGGGPCISDRSGRSGRLPPSYHTLGHSFVAYYFLLFAGAGLTFHAPHAAEDFYANDYPDEEVRSDDEYGRGAYRYRKNASDDEDWAEDVGSDDDERSRYPWKGNAWGV